ncbi:MAG: PQQ-binding-like beta-propeller repeat protein [Planctomycetes bacterium]|nr:PQQ-binding-like beta-propeller repeat protein [Planctomycetota bacterium]MCW8134222.1 PQQ-binding-like beta-propeller repeat protein [Planctomycetota bacterium]
MRRIFAAFVLIALALAHGGAQLPPRVQYPEADPTAFSITTQADLEDALSRIARNRAALADARTPDDRRFHMTAILEICQRELNREANTSGVVVVERAPNSAVVPDLPLRWQGAYSAIEDQIRALGKEGLDLYEQLYGPRVQLQLADILRTRDRNRLADLNRRFGLTLAGAKAAVALAGMYWEEGGLSQTARMLERALENAAAMPAADRAYLYAWLGHCYRERGERASLRRIIDESTPVHAEKVRIGDAAVTLGELLKQRMSQARDASHETIDRFGTHWPGGNYANTGLHERPAAYSKQAWVQNLPSLAATRHTTRFMGYNPPIVPPYMPVFDGNAVYISQGDALLAYDLVSGGTRPLWTCKPFPAMPHNWRTMEPDPSLSLPVSVHAGTVYAALENPLSTAYHSRDPDPNFRLYSHYPKVKRALCAVDAATGRLLWKVGGEYEGDELYTLNFLSAVVYEGVLYAVASKVEALSDIFVVALRPETGDVLWRLRLCYGQQETTMFGRPAREPIPSLPAFSGGLMYLCTNIGGAVAVDLNTRGIRWVTRYEYTPRPVSKYIDTYYRDVSWFNSPTMYAEHEGRAYVVFAPTDAEKMFAVDAVSGAIVWRMNREGQPLYGGRALVGVREGSVVVAGDGGIRGGASSMLHLVSLAGGVVTRSTAVVHEKGGRMTLVGRPGIASNRVYWPGMTGGSGAAIAEVDLDTMRVVQSVDVSASYGTARFSVFVQNGVLYTVAGRDYSLGNSQLAVRYDATELLRNARKELDTRPNDAEACLRLGLLTMRLGDSTEGLRLVRRAYELAIAPPPNARVRDRAGTALVAEYLSQADAAMLRRKWIDALAMVELARSFSVTRSQRTECFVRHERVLISMGNLSDLADFYRGVIKANPDFGVGADPELPAVYYATVRLAAMQRDTAPAESVDLLHTLLGASPRLAYEGTPLRAYTLGALKDILARHKREPFKAADRAAQLMFEETASPDQWRRVLELFPFSPASDQAAFNLGEHELGNHRPDAGAQVLRAALHEYAERARVGDLNVLLALCYSRAGAALRARLLATRLLRTYPQGSMQLQGKQRTYKELLEPLLRGEVGDEGAESLPRLPGTIAELWRARWDAGGFTRLPRQPAVSTNRIYLGERSGDGATRLVAREGATGKVVWSAQTPVTLTDTRRTSRGTLFVLGQGMSMFDDEGNEVWSAPSTGSPQATSVFAGMLVYATGFTNHRSRRNNVRVTAREAASGAEVWEAIVDAVSTRWIQQSAHGVHALVLGDETALLLLDPENGEVRARAAIPIDGRVTVSPLVLDGKVIITDRDGRLLAFDAESLAPGKVIESRIRIPTRVEPRGKHVVVVGLTSACMLDPATGQPQWRIDLPQNEQVTSTNLLAETLMIATRAQGNIARVVGYHVKDGKQAFSYTVARENDNDRVDLLQDAAFSDGVALAYADYRIVDGVMRLWGFRLIVMNADGTERLRWEHRVTDSPSYVQLAVTEDFIAFTCDNTTFGFGAK